MHDSNNDAVDNQYFPADIFTGYHAAKTTFVIEAVKAAKKNEVIILSHINLLLVAWLIKKTKPSIQIYLLAHGIEIWGALSNHKKLMLPCCNKIISVSNFTSNKIAAEQGINHKNLCVLNNCIDPYLVKPTVKLSNTPLAQKYGINKNDKVLFTLTRLSAKDRYKGYDFVIHALAQIVKTQPQVKYILAGSYKAKEKTYLDTIISNNNLQHHVIITGYLKDEDLAAHFALATAYVMPSVKEGFGIVFIEAMYYGLPIIAGNADGSVDALLNGKLGILIEPESVDAIVKAVIKIFENPQKYKPNNELLMDNFGYEAYKKNVEAILN